MTNQKLGFILLNEDISESHNVFVEKTALFA